MSLGRNEPQLAVDTLHRLTNEQSPPGDVAVLPAETEDFSSVEASRQGHDEDAFQAVTVQLAEKN
jgi:hypothetical protein